MRTEAPFLRELAQGEECPGQLILGGAANPHPVVHPGAGGDRLPAAEQLLNVHGAACRLAQRGRAFLQTLLFILPFLNAIGIRFLALLLVSDPSPQRFGLVLREVRLDPLGIALPGNVHTPIHP